MSRDFTPQENWILGCQEEVAAIFFSNIRVVMDGKSQDMFTNEELEDRKAHRYVAILAPGMYKSLRETLEDSQFERLNDDLGRLAEADKAGESTAGFPKEMTDWFYNRHGHHYREPNDEDFMRFVKREYRERKNDFLYG